MAARDDVPRLDAEALEEILEVTRELARPLDIDTMLEHVIDAGRRVLNAERGSVFVYDVATDELVSRVATGADELRVPADRGIVGECARTRRVINVPDCYADPRFNPEVDRQTGFRTRCLMAVPLVGHDESLEGVLQVLNKENGVFDDADERIATVLGAQCAVALQRTRFMKDLVEKERMEQEIAVARDIQMRVFPRSMPELAGYDVAGWCKPADETGGDVFDLIELSDGRLILLLGDATGHGIGPALSVTQVRAMLRMCVRFGADINNAMRHINDQLADDLASNRFVTVFLGLLEPVAHRVLYHSGGQAPILHFCAGRGKVEWLPASTQPLGILSGLEMGDACAMELAPGDILGLVTDGIYEFENGAGEQYGEERLAEVLIRHQTEPMSGLIERIVQSTENFAGGTPQKDDMTILLVRRLPG